MNIEKKFAAIPSPQDLNDPLKHDGRVFDNKPSAPGEPLWCDPVPLGNARPAWLADGRIGIAIGKPDGGAYSFAMTESEARVIVAELAAMLGGKDKDLIPELKRVWDAAKAKQRGGA